MFMLFNFSLHFCFNFQVLFILSLVNPIPLISDTDYDYPYWSHVLGWLIVCSSIIPIPVYMTYRFLTSGKAFTKEVCENKAYLYQHVRN